MPGGYKVLIFPVAFFLVVFRAVALVSYWFILIHDSCILLMCIYLIFGLADERAHYMPHCRVVCLIV